MAKQVKNIKIALVGYKLATGGVERVLSTVSELLDQSDCEVHVIILEDEIEFPYAGTLLNLGNDSKFKKYFKLRSYLKMQHFHYVIDFRHRVNPWMELIFLNFIYRGIKTIYTVHTSNLKLHFTDKDWVAKQIFTQIDKVVSVSTEMNEKIKREYNFKNGFVIPNCISAHTTDVKCEGNILPFQYIIAVGRLVALKQFDKLIETYCNSELPKRGIHLVLLGNGIEELNLKKQIRELKMERYVHLLGFQEEPFCYIKNAKFLTLTSEYEGFGMVILEALSLGTPVVSFDCETGPNEMIINETNGLLVENQNFELLHKALNQMVDDTALYDFCKKNAKTSVKAFSAEIIRKKWLTILNSSRS